MPRLEELIHFHPMENESKEKRVCWIPAYSVAVERLDHQHRHLIDLIQALRLSEGSGEETEATADSLEAMERYAAEHLREEEAMMEKAGYGDLAAHREAHAFFTKEVSKIRDLNASGDVKALDEAADFLVRWFVDHVIETDSKYVESLKTAGLTDGGDRS